MTRYDHTPDPELELARLGIITREQAAYLRGLRAALEAHNAALRQALGER